MIKSIKWMGMDGRGMGMEAPLLRALLCGAYNNHAGGWQRSRRCHKSTLKLFTEFCPIIEKPSGPKKYQLSSATLPKAR